MAELIWTEPALNDLDAIADYIALGNQKAAKSLVRRVFKHVSQLAKFPKNRSSVPELPNSPIRQIIEPPCRVFYRIDGGKVIILHVRRDSR